MEKIIQEAKDEYKKYLSIFCPYISQEISFTSSGFKHMLWKSNGTPRSSGIIKERLAALKFVKDILSKSGTLQEYEKLGNRDFFAFIAIVEDKKYKVVVTKYNTDKYKFVSVIPKWKTGIRDDV